MTVTQRLNELDATPVEPPPVNRISRLISRIAEETIWQYIEFRERWGWEQADAVNATKLEIQGAVDGEPLPDCLMDLWRAAYDWGDADEYQEAVRLEGAPLTEEATQRMAASRRALHQALYELGRRGYHP